MRVRLECMERFAINGGPLYVVGERPAFDAAVANVLLRDFSRFWRMVPIGEAASRTLAPTQAPKDRMIRRGQTKGRA